MKKIEVLIRAPEDWLGGSDLNSLEALIGRTTRRFEDALLEEAVKKVINKIKIPSIKISKKELKQAILEKMAEERMENYD